MGTEPEKDVVPVQATMETTTKWPTGGTTASSKFSRDAKSRTHIECGDIVSVHDPEKGQSFLLHPPKKIVIPTVARPSMIPKPPALPAPQASVNPPASPELKETADLGKRVINGVEAHGKQYAMPVPGKSQPATSEIWTSPHLKLPIQSSVHDSSTGTTTVTQMKNIVPDAKLDPRMFQVPSDYKVVPPAPPSPVSGKVQE
jgi:hypothetical protein